MLFMKETSKTETEGLEMKIYKTHTCTHRCKMLSKRGLVKYQLIEENINFMEIKKNIS